MRQEKTVIEWFAQAILDGHDWGAKAIVEVTRAGNGKDLIPSLSAAIWYGFTWRSCNGFKSTDLAHEYWQKIYDSVVESERKESNTYKKPEQ